MCWSYIDHGIITYLNKDFIQKAFSPFISLEYGVFIAYFWFQNFMLNWGTGNGGSQKNLHICRFPFPIPHSPFPVPPFPVQLNKGSPVAHPTVAHLLNQYFLSIIRTYQNVQVSNCRCTSYKFHALKMFDMYCIIVLSDIYNLKMHEQKHALKLCEF